MRIFRYQGGIQISPETKQEAEMIGALMKNARISSWDEGLASREAIQEFLDRLS